MCSYSKVGDASMRGMILAAGRGARMGTLTAEVPKPLLRVANRYLIEYSLAALIKAGIKEVVINVSYLGEKIKYALGDGARYGITIRYSEEPEALETGGGIYQALPLLGSDPFVVLSADIITDYSLRNLPSQPEGLAHLVLIDNPSYHPQGDFCLTAGKIHASAGEKLTFSNVGIYRPELFAECQPGKFRLGALLKQVAQQNKITGEHYKGVWHNCGTPEELGQISTALDIF